MKTNIIKRQTPEEEELQKKCEELAVLENELAQHELDLATLEAELNFFLTRYLGTVGKLYSELDEINAQIAEAEATLKPKEKIAQDKAKEARNRAEESAKTTQDVNQSEQPQKFKPSDSLKRLYREVAKKSTRICAPMKRRGFAASNSWLKQTRLTRMVMKRDSKLL